MVAAFEEYIFEAFASKIASYDAELTPNIYALGLLVHFEDQDPRRGTVGLVYNTYQHYQNELRLAVERCPAIAETVEKTEAAAVEVKWHFESWVQHDLWVRNELDLVAKGHNPNADLEGAALRRSWMECLSLWYSDEEEEAGFEKTLKISGHIDEAFGMACARIARRLHTETIIERKFGHSIPIVFHNYYYDAEAAERTREANPPGLAEEFEQYVLVVRHS